MTELTSTTRLAGGIDSLVARRLLYRMLLIRQTEEAMIELYRRNLIPGFIHPAIGEEAIHVGVCDHLCDLDQIGATHRGHGQAIAKGVDLGRLMAEVLGRRDGLLGGRGGSLHIGDWDAGVLPASSLVAGGLGTMTGVALAHKQAKDGGVAVCFFGDGALNRGATHEAMNLAAIWRLPIVFACTDNGWAISVPRRSSTAGELIDRARAYGIPGGIVDGKDICGCYEAAGEAIDRARSGMGPTVLFFDCPRGYGHEEGDSQDYRPREEREAAARRDPIPAAERVFLDAGLLSSADIAAVRTRVRDEVSSAVAFGLSSDAPDPADALRRVRPGQAE